MQAKYFNPLYIAKAVRNRTLFWMARQLRPYLVRSHVIWGDAGKVRIGKNVVLADSILNTRSGTIEIGDDVFFGHNVLILAGTHDIRRKGRARQLTLPQSGRDIVIRQGAWITSNVTVVGPCDIGEHAVITAGSVVTGKVEAGMIYAGNPAKPVKPITFDED